MLKEVWISSTPKKAEIEKIVDILKKEGWTENMMEGCYYSKDRRILFHYNRSPYNGQFLILKDVCLEDLNYIDKIIDDSKYSKIKQLSNEYKERLFLMTTGFCTQDCNPIRDAEEAQKKKDYIEIINKLDKIIERQENESK